MKWRIAVASSGLGHIHRGIESWAQDLGLALHRSGANVTLFQGAGQPTEPWIRRVPCFRRFDPPATRIAGMAKHLGGWRYGCGSTYDVEQSSFAFFLWRRIRKDYDILHVQDPLVASRLQFLNRRGLSRPRVILAHGTEESTAFLQRFSYLQHLAPCYQEGWRKCLAPGQLSFAVPNFVDTQLFRPGDRQASRAIWGLPQDALVVLSVAALKKTHKRCDYLIREFAEFQKVLRQPAILVMAGAHERESPEVIEIGKSLLGGSVSILESVDRQRLPSLYQAADIYAIASLHEMMPIAMLEAISSGLPVTCNLTPTLEWMVGPCGVPEDISVPEGLVRQWLRLVDPDAREAAAAAARKHAETTFAEGVVLKQIEEMYTVVTRN